MSVSASTAATIFWPSVADVAVVNSTVQFLSCFVTSLVKFKSPSIVVKAKYLKLGPYFKLLSIDLQSSLLGCIAGVSEVDFSSLLDSQSGRLIDLVKRFHRSSLESVVIWLTETDVTDVCNTMGTLVAAFPMLLRVHFRRMYMFCRRQPCSYESVRAQYPGISLIVDCE